jgi:hypothetical protein
MRTFPPAAGGDDGPDGFDQAERPSALEKSVDGAEHAGGGETKHVPAATGFKRVADDHGRDGEESEGVEGRHG